MNTKIFPLLLAIFLFMNIAFAIQDPFQTNQSTQPSWTDQIRNIPIQNIFTGSVNFAFHISSALAGFFSNIGVLLGAPSNIALVIGIIGAFSLFGLITISLLFSFGKIVKYSAKWGILIILIILAVSIIFGFIYRGV